MFRRWFEHWFPQRSLDGLEGRKAPIRVRVEGIIEGPEVERSPVTDRRAVLIDYRFFDRYYFGSGEKGRYGHRELGRYVLGEHIVVIVGEARVSVPMANATLAWTGVWTALPLAGALSKKFVLEHPAAQLARQELTFDEKVLEAGARVRLTGYVQAAPRQGGALYRRSAEPNYDFIVRAAHPIEIKEIFDFPEGIGL